MNRNGIFVFTMVSILSLSCESVGTLGNEESPRDEETSQSSIPNLVLDADTFYIKADGQDACDFCVRLDGKPLTAGYVISKIEDGIEEIYDSDSWTSSVEKECTFIASYQMPDSVAEDENAEPVIIKSSKINVKAVSYDVPVTPVDSDPEKLNFVRRIFLTHFTGTECTACPGMRTELEKYFSNESKASKVVLASVHSGVFTESDPARLEGVDLHDALGAKDKPAIFLNMNKSYSCPWVDGFLTNLDNKIIRSFNESSAKAGISVNSVNEGDLLRVKVSVKAAEQSEFRLAAWILEDGIEGLQEGTSNPAYNIHNNCVRAVEGEVKSGDDYSGYRLGTISQGCRAEYVFEFGIDSKWNLDRCHLVVYVTTPSANGKNYYVNNVIDCPIIGQTPYEYAE